MELVPGIVWHEVETIKKRYHGNSRVEPEGSMETKPEDVFLYVYLCFFCWVGLLFWDLAHSSGKHILEFLFGLADTKSWNIYQLRNWAKSFERRAMLTEPPRKTSEDPVLRRSVGNTLATTINFGIHVIHKGFIYGPILVLYISTYRWTSATLACIVSV